MGADLDLFDAGWGDGPVGVTSTGLLDMRHLGGFLRRPVVRLGAAPVAAVAGWGERPSGRRARREALRRELPLALLEDGFLRSVGLGKDGAPTVSITIDRVGAYFDARVATQLEELLLRRDWATPPLLERGGRGLEVWRAERLSKYNTGAEGEAGPCGLVVLVDQVAGDRSIEGAGASPSSFQRMLDWALQGFGADRLALRRHPDAVAGKARGCLEERARRLGLRLLPDGLSAPAVLENADRLVTVSSQLGFEALLRGTPVTTFAMPFYAGYGLTEDLADGVVAAEARRRRGGTELDILQLFTAACLIYARYADPVSLQPLQFEGAVDRLLDWRARSALNAGWSTRCVGVRRWKRPVAHALLGGAGARVELGSKSFGSPPSPRLEPRTAVWGYRDRGRSPAGVVLRVEDGFLRSVGLGAKRAEAVSWVADDVGLYYDSRGPNRFEQIMQDGVFPPELLVRARALRADIVRLGLTKYNLGGASVNLRRLAGDRAILAVAEQVPGDAAVRLGAGEVASGLELLMRLRRDRPDAFIIYKEHPDLVARVRRGRRSRRELAMADLVISAGDFSALFAELDELHTLSSLAGFEALLRGTPVVTWGRPFYGGWGLTRDRETFPRRTRRASLDELTAAALILYPRYFDPRSGLPCSPEDAVRLLAASLGP
jgi:capsular polysaccharide export protein